MNYELWRNVIEELFIIGSLEKKTHKNLYSYLWNF